MKKGDVGMSLHEKERNKKMPTPRHKVTHNPIPTSLLCFNMLLVCYDCIRQSKQHNILTSNCLHECRDGVMSDFVSLCPLTIKKDFEVVLLVHAFICVESTFIPTK